MDHRQDSSSKVLKNTGILYLRLILTIGVSLYSTRLVLNALGVTDYGLYNLIAGVIFMLSFLNSAMATSTQRFLSFYQGKQEITNLRKIFDNSVILHILIGLLILLTLETAGTFLFDGILNIPSERLFAAESVFHFMTVTVFFSIVSVPFSATLTSHENMLWVAIFNVVEVLLKFLVAVAISYTASDKLVLYGFFLAIISVINLSLYVIYTLKNYEECRLDVWKSYDKSTIKELSSFAGWNLFGAACSVGKVHGIAVILNIFLGPAINAAYGIANQVSSQMNFFSTALLQALNPQIMSSEGAGDRRRMLDLSMVASKFGFFLLAFIAIPCIFEMKGIIFFWLKSTPSETVSFCQLILISVLVNQLTIGLQSAIQATGRIKIYQVVVGSFQLLNLPIAIVFLTLHLNANYVLSSFILIELLACCLRMWFLKHYAGLSIRTYAVKVFLKELVPGLVAVTTCALLTSGQDYPYRFVVTITISIMIFMISVYFFGLERKESDYVINTVKKLSSNIKSKQ